MVTEVRGFPITMKIPGGREEDGLTDTVQVFDQLSVLL